MRDVRFKICDLCGAPNLVENTECHVCGWRGHFSTDPAKVRLAIEAARKLQFRQTTREASPLCLLRWRIEQAWVHLQEWYRRRRRSPRFPFW